MVLRLWFNDVLVSFLILRTYCLGVGLEVISSFENFLEANVLFCVSQTVLGSCDTKLACHEKSAGNFKLHGKCWKSVFLVSMLMPCVQVCRGNNSLHEMNVGLSWKAHSPLPLKTPKELSSWDWNLRRTTEIEPRHYPFGFLVSCALWCIRELTWGRAVGMTNAGVVWCDVVSTHFQTTQIGTLV